MPGAKRAEDRLRAWKLKDRGQTFVVYDPEWQREDKAGMVRLWYASEKVKERRWLEADRVRKELTKIPLAEEAKAIGRYRAWANRARRVRTQTPFGVHCFGCQTEWEQGEEVECEECGWEKCPHCGKCGCDY